MGAIKSQTAAMTNPLPASDPCVHCGFCLPTCASYRVLGTEMDSPRGRIHTLKAIAAGELNSMPPWPPISIAAWAALPASAPALLGCATTS